MAAEPLDPAEISLGGLWLDPGARMARLEAAR